MTTTTHALALASFLGINPDEVKQLTYDHYGLPLFYADGAEYAVGTDSEAQEACVQYVESSVWAFNASFILSECGLPSELESAIKAFQEDKCEGSNDALLALVEKCCKAGNRHSVGVDDGLEAFTQSAISADGRGHFLSTYDGDENEQEHEGDTYYIYRTN